MPPDRQPDLIAWLFPLIGDDDRENMLRIQQAVLPPDVFAGVVQLVRKAVGDDWAGLVQRMPDIASRTQVVARVEDRGSQRIGSSSRAAESSALARATRAEGYDGG